MPARITALVPRTGSSASQPGNGDASVTTNKATPISPRPATATTLRATWPRPRARRGANTASRPPAANSHTRVNVEKYALSGEAVEACTDHARLAAVASASTVTMPARWARPPPRRSTRAATTIEASSASGMTR